MKLPDDNTLLTVVGNDRAIHFAAGFLAGRGPIQSSYIQATAFEMMKYDHNALIELKFEYSLLGVAKYLIRAAEMFDVACKER